MAGILIKTYLRLSLRNPLRTALMVIGIALGVAGVIAIDISKSSIGKSFELSASSLTSRSSHQIMGSSFTVPQNLFTILRKQLGIKNSAPVIARHVKSDQMGDSIFTLLGIDPFSEQYFRTFETINSPGAGSLDLTSGAPAVLVSRSNARQYRLELNTRLFLRIKDKQIETRVAGFLDPDNQRGKSAADGIILTDIATAQEMLEMGDRISRIDLRLREDQVDRVKQILPSGVFLVETDKHNQVIRDMAASFETSLTAFSMLS
ncbi:MAG: ABC transporter permease, partial [Chlorobiales bacterium]|nr:ABC transporter permease [Chlorobiales bacterium]